MKTAFVLSGGGSLGAIQVGMLAALDERDLTPDMLVGTSVGAINASFVAAHGFDTTAINDLDGLWSGIRRSDVFPFDPIRQTLALTGHGSSMVSSKRLERLIDTDLPLDDLTDARVPVHVVATDVMSGEEVLLSSGDAVSAVLASASIPGVFGPVRRNGRILMDGGVSNNTAVSRAVELGAERIVVLPAGFACALNEPPDTPLAAGIHALTLLIETRLFAEVEMLSRCAEIIVLPPLCPLSVSPADFGHTRELITRGRRSAGEWLDEKRYETEHPERVLSLHSHHIDDPGPRTTDTTGTDTTGTDTARR